MKKKFSLYDKPDRGIIADQGIAELQIIFKFNAYLPPNSLINADFQKFNLYFHPLYFFAMRKREVNTVLKCISVFLCRFKHRFGSDLPFPVVLYCQHLFL